MTVRWVNQGGVVLVFDCAIYLDFFSGRGKKGALFEKNNLQDSVIK